MILASPMRCVTRSRSSDDALQTSGYVNPRSEASAEEKLRRLVSRLHLQAADAEVLLGMLHAILWKLRSKSWPE